MTDVLAFPRQRGTDSLKSFWRLSNPAMPDIEAIRVEHNEDWSFLVALPPTMCDTAALTLFVPIKVAKCLGFDLSQAAYDLVRAPDSSVMPLAKIGPISLEWAGTVAEDQMRREYPGLSEKREQLLPHAYAWEGRVVITPSIVLGG